MLSEGQMRDFKGAVLIISALPVAKLLGARCDDADWFRKALDERRITACVPGRSNRRMPIG
jgi:hypothetical protein